MSRPFRLGRCPAKGLHHGKETRPSIQANQYSFLGRGACECHNSLPVAYLSPGADPPESFLTALWPTAFRFCGLCPTVWLW
jgi:hypothetical protein